MKAILILIGLVLCAPSVQSQSFTFTDAASGEPVKGVLVFASDVTSGKVHTAISNDSGQLHFEELQFPVSAKSQHVAYQPWQDTLSIAKAYQITLSPLTNRLDDIIVTGQFSAQSVKKSVFSVKVIDSEEITARNAVSLSEVLNNTLNIRLSEDLAIGSTSASLLGVSGQNIKILMDGVPLVNRNGNGNNADLSQINLNLIERIEIVEGPMAVNYGANALAGVINLITKKTFSQKTEVTLNLQEESAGTEYGIDKGRHIQNLAISHNLSPRFSFQFGLQRNDFSGFQGNAGSRQYEWNPKRQWQTNALLRYTHKGFQIHYRLDYLNELISDFGLPQNNFLPGGENQLFAIDEEYHSQRYIHQLQFQGVHKALRYNGFFSYSDFKREKSRFSNNLVTQIKNITTGTGDQDVSTYEVFEAGGSLSSSLSPTLHYQSGYQLTFEKVGGGRITDTEQNLENIAIYSSVEWQPSKTLTLRPGARFTYNSIFGSQLMPSLQVKFSPKNEVEWRAAYGRGFRTPSIRELYFEFVDTNHRVFGNPDLGPEQSHYISLNAQKTYQIGSLTVKTEFNTFFNTIDNQIGLAQSAIDATAVSYINIDRFKTLGGTLTQRFESAQLSWSFGFSYIGRYNDLEALDIDDLKVFLYTPEANTSLSYNFKSDLRANLFYKYSGRLQSYITTETAEGNTATSIGQIAPYHWLDLNISRAITQSIDLTLGVKNLLDVQQINNSGASGGTHTAGPGVPISYGRSYLIKLNYNLKTND